jgi:hypothetical protein
VSPPSLLATGKTLDDANAALRDFGIKDKSVVQVFPKPEKK